MPRHGLLEIDVSRRDENTCLINVNYQAPDDPTPGRPTSGEAPLNLRELYLLRNDREAYGRTLADALLSSPDVRRVFTEAQVEAKSYDALRVRLYVGGAQSAMHGVLWETLADPADSSRWLLTNERVLFSRYVAPDRRFWGLPPPAGAMRVLIVVANPPHLAERPYFDPGARAEGTERRLAPIDVDKEVARVRSVLTSGVTDTLVSGVDNPSATSVRNIGAKLHTDFDVLYLVCHGALLRSDPNSAPEPLLYLGSHDGKSAAVPGADLVAALQDLPALPRLVVLVSCESAGTGAASIDDGGAFAALAPSLAKIGVPAVLGMQGKVTMATMAEFMPMFFAELAKDGQIDRAVAAARGHVQQKADAWMPVLYLQSRDGRLWAPASAHAVLSGFQQWNKLVDTIRAGECTAVLGSGLFDSALVPQRRIANRWMKEAGLPFVEHGPEDLPHVAQYIAAVEGPPELRRKWLETLDAELREEYSQHLPEDAGDLSLEELISAIGKWRRTSSETPHQVLAKLPFKTYIVTTPDNLMADALVEAKRKPEVEVFRWNVGLDGLPRIEDRDPLYRPSERRPLVYHLLGHIKYPASVVLSEDQYLECLTRIKNPEVNTMTYVEAALREFPLLLLGFQFDDWDFRVLFRAIAGGQREKRGRVDPLAQPSVAVQLSPDDRFTQPKLVQRYIERYFGIANLAISWGSPESFTRELWRQWTTPRRTDVRNA